MRYRLLTAGVLVVFLASAGVVPAFAEEAPLPSTVAFATSYLEERSVTDLGNLQGVLTLAEAIRISFDANPQMRKAVEDMRKVHARPAFTDVDPISPFAPYGRVALEKGLVMRNIDRSLRPNRAIRAEEAIALLLGTPYATTGDWFVPAVREALVKNVIADPRSLSVGGDMSRGQFIDMAYRLAVVREKKVVAFNPDTAHAPQSGAQVAVQQPGMPPLPTVLAAAPAGEEIRAKYGSAKYFSITVPALDIWDVTVTHPEDSVTRDGLLSVLDRGAGHLYAVPGRGGKSMIYAHSSNYDWMDTPYSQMFVRASELQAGDKIYVTFDGNTYAYSVTYQEVIDPDDTTPFEGDGEELILYTCWPPKSVKERLIVRAVPDVTVAVR